ncbi:MAG: hypothetical protein L6R40_004120 [Gallowayella cf. fulva]|nr:MAG: hypothetical protein L6R40_004120 [Xanthomendoza cf. fulva]
MTSLTRPTRTSHIRAIKTSLKDDDHFYVCPAHLKHRDLCTPLLDEAEAAEKKKKEDLDREIELVKAEYAAKLEKRIKSKEKKKKENTSEASKDKEKIDNKADDSGNDEKLEKEKNDKIKAVTERSATIKIDDSPRIFILQKDFFQRRLDRIRNAEIAKRNRERLQNPNLFPSVPSGDLG